MHIKHVYVSWQLTLKSWWYQGGVYEINTNNGPNFLYLYYDHGDKFLSVDNLSSHSPVHLSGSLPAHAYYVFERCELRCTTVTLDTVDDFFCKTGGRKWVRHFVDQSIMQCCIIMRARARPFTEFSSGDSVKVFFSSFLSKIIFFL